MRPVTKIILVLSLVAMAVVVLYIASRKWDTGPTPPQAPVVAQRSEGGTPPVPYNDPLATAQRWRDRFSGGDTPPAPPATNNSTRRTPPVRDLQSTSRHEGTVAAHRQEEPVAGADPPGPVLRPTGVIGELVTGRLRSGREIAESNAYTIVQGDTLSAIALKHYGDLRYVQAIQSANPGVDPSRLRVGDRLIMPEKQERPAAGATMAGSSVPAAPAAPAAPATKVYVVQRNDTLIGIARKVYGDATMYPRVYEANKDVLSSPNARLYVGQRLRMPEPH